MNESKNSEHSQPFVIPVPSSSLHQSSVHHPVDPSERANLALDTGRTWNLGHEPWPKPVEGRLLLDELAAVYAKFVVLPEGAPEALALWTVHTHAFHLRERTAYLGIQYAQRPPRKGRLLDVLGSLVDRPVVAAQVRSRELLRVIDERRSTLLVDEIENLISENDELRDVLNSDPCRSSAFVVRVDNEHNRNSKVPVYGLCPTVSTAAHASPPIFSPGLKVFSSWCPKAMAAVRHLPDLFAERCIFIRMRRKTRKDHCEPLKNLARYASSLRRKCARFVLDCSHKITNARPQIPLDARGRLGHAWEPLFPLADLAGEPWPGLARQAAQALAKSAKR